MSDSVTISHSVFASVAHRYWNSEWSHEKNLQVYGGDASVEGIGSNLRLELAASAAAGQNEQALLPALMDLKSMVDHQCLFAEASPFAQKPSTVENIGLFLAQQVMRFEWTSLTVWESEHLACVVRRGRPEVTLRFKIQNLSLEVSAPVNMESGIAVPRAPVRQAVHELYVKLNEFHQADLARWSQLLFSSLSKTITGLQSLQIDLGRHESVVVHS